MTTIRNLLACCALLGAGPFAQASAAPGEFIPFDSPRWAVKAGSLVEHLGRQSLAGTADLKDVQLENGTIEVDVAVTGERCFPGVSFRASDDDNLELVYLRPHKPKAADALQYTPVSGGLGSWQLYSGRGFTASVDIPYGRWIHLKLEISGTRARVFVDDMTVPALVINDLKLGARRGFVGLRAPTSGIAHFAGFSITQAESLDLGPAPRTGHPSGMLRSWEVSRVIPLRQLTRTLPPSVQELGDLAWLPVTAEPSGLVDIARHRKKSGTAPECVLARTVIHSDGTHVKKLTFGYSDEVHVFLNGSLLFTGDSSFTRRDPEFNGIVGLNDTLVLPLRDGKNELLLVVTEVFGGWGFLCRLESLPTSQISVAAGGSLQWEIRGGLRSPESAAWDAKREVLFVSNANLASPPSALDGFVSRIARTGEIRDLKWVVGLDRPTGLALAGGSLYVVERHGVAIVDPDTGEVVARRSCPSTGLLNDPAVDSSGNVFISDSRAGIIYRASAETCEPWISGWPLLNPNGILLAGDHLVVGNMGDSRLLLFRLADRTLTDIIELPQGYIDGVESDGNGGFMVSHYDGRVFHVAPDGHYDVVIDTTAAGLPCADISYVPLSATVFVPTLAGDSLLAFGLGEGAGSR